MRQFSIISAPRVTVMMDRKREKSRSISPYYSSSNASDSNDSSLRFPNGSNSRTAIVTLAISTGSTLMFPAHHLMPFRSFPMTSFHGACFIPSKQSSFFSQSFYFFIPPFMHSASLHLSAEIKQVSSKHQKGVMYVFHTSEDKGEI